MLVAAGSDYKLITAESIVVEVPAPEDLQPSDIGDRTWPNIVCSAKLQGAAETLRLSLTLFET